MEKGCPLCNGIIDVCEICPYCGMKMEDGGSIDEYFDPYSPYVELKDEMGNVKKDRCLHLVYCPFCGNDKKVYINKVSLLGY